MSDQFTTKAKLSHSVKSIKADPPLVTVIMPVRNEASFIENSLTSVLNQDYPARSMEVLVVDGESVDGTPSIARNVSTRNGGPEVRILDNPGRIVPTGFNLALDHARGDIIVRVDGHCILESDYVSRCVEALESTDADNVGGCQRPVGRSMVGQAIAIGTSSPFGVGNAKFHYAHEPGWADTVYLGAWRRNVFDRIGGFDEELVRNQDDEFNFRLQQQGGKVWLDPKIRSTYFCRGSLWRLWRQYFQYGVYKVLVAKKRGGIASWRHVMPATFVLALGTTVLLAAVTANLSWLLPVAGVYAAANLVSSVVAARANPKTVPCLPFVFAILHVAYGSGFLWGLWQWRDWKRRSKGAR